MKKKHMYTTLMAVSLMLVGVQRASAVHFIPSDTSIGTWDKATRTYTLMIDIDEGIEVEADDLTLDGAGHTVNGTGTGYGVYLYGRTGVSVKNLNVQGFKEGIYLSDSSGNTLTNNAANSNEKSGILLIYSSNNTLTSNTVNSNNQYGIYLRASSYSTLTGNNALNNDIGIDLAGSANNTLRNNTMADNRQNYVTGSGSFDQDVDTTNTVDGKPIYYLRNTIGGVYDSSTNAGVIYAIDCDSITIRDLTLTNNGFGVFLWNTHNSTLQNISASNNQEGIRLDFSSNNTVEGNTISNNGEGVLFARSTSCNTVKCNTVSNNKRGIHLKDEGDNNNQIYNNNFLDNATQAIDECGGNVFNLDIPIGGNYWSNWTGPDNNSDGFIDFPYVFDGGQDALPLVAVCTYTEEGSDVEVTPQDGATGTSPVTLTFETVTESGDTSLIISDSGTEPPSGFELVGEYYDLSTTASYQGTIQVCIQYDDTGMTPEQENGLRLYHYEDGAWIDVTILPVDTNGNIICGVVNSLSPFAILADVQAPIIHSISVDPDVLWPANHKMVEVEVSVEVTDNSDPAICGIVWVICNEPVIDPEDGNTDPDWDFTEGPLTVLLRAERAGTGTGRAYTIEVACTDASGNTSIAEVVVTIPHDQGKSKK